MTQKLVCFHLWLFTSGNFKLIRTISWQMEGRPTGYLFILLKDWRHHFFLCTHGQHSVTWPWSHCQGGWELSFSCVTEKNKQDWHSVSETLSPPSQNTAPSELRTFVSDIFPSDKAIVLSSPALFPPTSKTFTFWKLSTLIVIHMINPSRMVASTFLSSLTIIFSNTRSSEMPQTPTPTTTSKNLLPPEIALFPRL